ncbi:uncharacterized protein PITG_14709 [Phytophthora infestans T30-4]|uniref:HTH CENPB-type domain-containing protein n=1 Tax=Phytophthora infestans (strain T30-4) TaxID=403677 RepID=D0NQW7_PHYIT|nr:uncharacterized protein PITG_14709 [Phytophthora infestans T30-4]EEY63065.1 conserved hypothetical protein [Phytophthora infestans T30-4]|eukprot:XP_002898588.1 conserved hypothetical protein [Phytophthora infestans T30-4]
MGWCNRFIARHPELSLRSGSAAATRKYNRKHMDAAVEMYLAGRPMSEVTQRFPLLHQRTIRRRVLRVQRGEVDKRRGPRPLLEGEPEQELVTWILAMQSQGTTV